MSDLPLLVAVEVRDLKGTAKGAWGAGSWWLCTMGSTHPWAVTCRQGGQRALVGKLCWTLALIWGGLKPLSGPREGTWRRLWVLENRPLCSHSLAAGFLHGAAPYLRRQPTE